MPHSLTSCHRLLNSFCTSGNGNVRYSFTNALVCIIDKSPHPISPKEGEEDYFQGDLSSKETIEEFCQWVIGKYGHVDYIVNNALPIMKGIDECSYEDFQYALSVGVTAPFWMVKA